jgi:chromosome partitioning protein
MITIAFFNNRSGVGQTSLVYHLAWALTELGQRVLIADLDPQANLSARCLPAERLDELWSTDETCRQTIFGAVCDVREELVDLNSVSAEPLSNRLGLLVGDIELSTFEPRLFEARLERPDHVTFSHQVTGALDRAVRHAALDWGAQVTLVDLGPNLGALNRTALVTADWIVTPLNVDLFSVQGLRSLGPTLKSWQREWAQRANRGTSTADSEPPPPTMSPAGYVVVQSSPYGNDVTEAYRKWAAYIPSEYARAFELHGFEPSAYHLATVNPYRSLEPMAYKARKPVFHLTAADGALGSHATATLESGRQFRALARRIGERVGLALPPTIVS